MMKSLIIRVDASTKIGTGHLMRCLALAQAWKDMGNKVTFIANCQSEGLLQRLRDEEFSLHALARSHPDPKDWGYTKDILASYPDAWVVLDNYHFDEVYHQQVKEAGHPLLVIDDMAHLKHYYADIVLNQNLHAEKLRYSCEPYTRLLLGTRYVLLRREFLAWRDWKRKIPEAAQHILVTLGGSDPDNLTLKVIQALQKVKAPELEATVVIGASNPHADELEAAARQSRIPIQLVRDASNMPELMSWADVAVSSAGTTVWELMFMGVPTLVVVLAPNQELNAQALKKRGIALSLSREEPPNSAKLNQLIQELLVKKQVRLAMSQAGRDIVDGQGAQRVVASIQEGRAFGLKLRPVRRKDCRLLWEWANDPAVRAVSFSSEFIPWEDHESWFRTKLSDPSCYYYILLSEEGVPVGQVRFDALDDEAEISVSLAPSFRSCGYGAEGIRIASKRLLQETAVTHIYAHIKPGNDASIQAFTEAGYKTSGTRVIKGHKALQMVLNKDEEDFEGALH